VTLDDNERIVDRYSQLARAALAGEAIRDCDGNVFDDGCFGAAAYVDDAHAPESALQASLGCGNPLAVADLRLGETVLDLGSGGGLDVLLRRVGPTGIAYGIDASSDMLALARANADKAHIHERAFPSGPYREHPAA
jgi:SAM-dependent methyltransferase